MTHLDFDDHEKVDAVSDANKASSLLNTHRKVIESRRADEFSHQTLVNAVRLSARRRDTEPATIGAMEILLILAAVCAASVPIAMLASLVK